MAHQAHLQILFGWYFTLQGAMKGDANKHIRSSKINQHKTG